MNKYGGELVYWPGFIEERHSDALRIRTWGQNYVYTAGWKKKNHFKTQLFVLHILIRVFWSDWSNQKFDIDCVGQVWWVVDLSPWLYCKMRLRSFARPTSSLELQHHNITIRTSNFVVDVIKRLAMTRRIFRATWKQFDGSSCRHMSWKASLNFGYYSKASHH